MPIPQLNENNELPAGVHVATMEEVEIEFGLSTERRKLLMTKLKSATDNLRMAKVKFIFLDGSFATDKPDPEDIDGCWSALGDIDTGILDPLFWDRRKYPDPLKRKALMKEKYGLDFYIAENIELGSNKRFPDFFQINRDGKPKGILQVFL